MSIILAMSLYSLSMSISPGPVNLIALYTGVNHGFRRALPFVSGATIGFIALFIFVGFGVGQIANNSTFIFELMRYAGASFIAYIGYGIITSSAELDSVKVKSSTFTKGVLLQWLNPKAWIASVSGIAAFNIHSLSQLALFASLYFTGNLIFVPDQPWVN